jgi:hypothetical protein
MPKLGLPPCLLTSCDRQKQGRPPSFFICDVSRSLTPPPCTFAQRNCNVPTFGNRCSLRSKLVFSIHHAIVDISHHNTNINFQISKLFTMLFDWAKGLISGYPMFGLGNYENEHNETLNKRFLYCLRTGRFVLIIAGFFAYCYLYICPY